MANICDFEMHIRGTEENCKRFLNALEQNGKYWMGRGAEIDIFDEDMDDDGTKTVYITGWCKWSLVGSLQMDAYSMRNGDAWDISKKVASGEIIPIDYMEACRRWQINMEAWSDEAGCCFSEHIICKPGEENLVEVHEYREEEINGEWQTVTKPEGFYEFEF